MRVDEGDAGGAVADVIGSEEIDVGSDDGLVAAVDFAFDGLAGDADGCGLLRGGGSAAGEQGECRDG